MTYQEAIKRIQEHIRIHRIGEYPHIKLGEALNLATAALREKAERENPGPLTLEELRRMEGEPVWVKIIGTSDFCWPKDAFDDYGLVRKSWVRVWDRSRADIFTVAHHFEEYGKSWLAYRNKPKEAEEK